MMNGSIRWWKGVVLLVVLLLLISSQESSGQATYDYSAYAFYDPPAEANTWEKVTVPLTAEAFGVDDATFQELMANVDALKIDVYAGPTGGLDSVFVGERFASRFDTVHHGWSQYSSSDSGSHRWVSSGGVITGYLQVDVRPSYQVNTIQLQSPADWAGDWRDLIGSSVVLHLQVAEGWFTSDEFSDDAFEFRGVIVSGRVSKRLIIECPWGCPSGWSLSRGENLNLYAQLSWIGGDLVDRPTVTLSTSDPSCVSVPESLKLGDSLDVRAPMDAEVGCTAVIAASAPGFAETSVALRVSGEPGVSDPDEGALDTDGDGVPDGDDQCPGTATGVEVGEDGCPVGGSDADEDDGPDEVGDADDDGVADDDDFCPDTPPGVDVGEDGCQLLEWETVCASAKCSIVNGSEFTHGEFTIGGARPQEIEVTASAEDFSIARGREIVYQVVDREPFGSLVLEPGSYALSCMCGGFVGPMTAQVCVKVPVLGAAAPPPDAGPPSSDPGLPSGPIARVVVRRVDKPADSGPILMEVGEEMRLGAWAEDAAGNRRSVTVEEWKVQDPNLGRVSEQSGSRCLFTAGPDDGTVRVMARAGGLTGVSPEIVVSREPPITFQGTVAFLDENGSAISPRSGLDITVSASEGGKTRQVGPAFTNARGAFIFKAPAQFKTSDSWLFSPQGAGLSAKPGYGWTCTPAPFTSPVSPGQTYTVQGLACQLSPQGIAIQGRVTHHGNPVGDADVALKRYGRVFATAKTDASGTYRLPVGGLSGRFWVTVEKKERYSTVNNWLKTHNPPEIDLPAQQGQTIDVSVLSWGEHIGYVGP